MFYLALAVTAASIRPAWAGLSNQEPDLLDVERAFVATARHVDDKTLELRFVIAPGYYLYRDRFHFEVNGQPVLVPPRAWPAGKWKQDATFGKVIIYRKSVHLLIPMPARNLDIEEGNLQPIALAVSSQGCADAGICYPPLRQSLAIVPGSSAWVTPQKDPSSGFSHGVRSGGAMSALPVSGK
jgi:thioredoxin:protein disulfide reductase